MFLLTTMKYTNTHQSTTRSIVIMIIKYLARIEVNLLQPLRLKAFSVLF